MIPSKLFTHLGFSLIFACLFIAVQTPLNFAQNKQENAASKISTGKTLHPQKVQKLPQGIESIDLDVHEPALQSAVKPWHVARSNSPNVQEIEPNNRTSEAQTLRGPPPITLDGNAETSDVGSIIDGGRQNDDMEDLFSVTILSPGLSVKLTGLSSNGNLYVFWFDRPGHIRGFVSAQSGTVDEELSGNVLPDLATLPPGNYFIGVSIFDPNPQGPTATPYRLTIEADIADAQNASLITIQTDPAGLTFNVNRREYF
ncbi:MAG: hypothetical protein D6814_00050, partial [Calditrichaeota bacterium]